jgi:hypothetical protein
MITAEEARKETTKNLETFSTIEETVPRNPRSL